MFKSVGARRSRVRARTKATAKEKEMAKKEKEKETRASLLVIDLATRVTLPVIAV